MPCNC